MIHLRDIHIGTDEANQLGEAEAAHALTFAIAFGVLTIAAGIVGTIAAIALAPDLTGLVFILIFGLGGAVIMLMLILGFRRGRQHRSDFVEAWRARQETENALKTAPPVETKEPETPKPPITSGVAQPELIGGIDVEDLRLLCRYITRRNKWTAEVLEGFELPASHIIITNKDTRSGTGEPQATTYARILKLFEPVIEGRGKGVTGTLTETDPDELLRKIRKIGTQQGQP